MSTYGISLSGLQNSSLAIDAASNNIANGTTVGYKAGEFMFADQFVKAVNPADRARVGMGSQNMGVRRPMIQGTVTNSSNPLDMAISGQGMFRLLSGSGSASSVDPGAVYYTRNGQFKVNQEGYIVNQNGMYLTGYQASPDGKQISDDLLRNHGLLKMPDNLLAGQKTSLSQIGAALDSTATAYTTTGNLAFDPKQTTYNNKTSQTVYDTDGNSHTLEVYYRRISDGTLKIRSEAAGTGYTYSPSPSSTPNVEGTTKVVINAGATLRMDTAALASTKASTASTGATVSLTALASNAGNAVDVTGKRLFINGVDSGVTVSSGGNSSTLTLSGSVNVPSGAALTFYDGVKATVTSSANATTNSTAVTLSAAASSDVTGKRMFINGVDSGAIVSSGGATTALVLSDAVSVPAGATLTFMDELNMTLISPDGQQVSVTGTTNKPASGGDLRATMAKVEVYTSLDGKFYDFAPGATSSRSITPQIAGLGYKPSALLEFIGGKNIDSFVTDALSGNPSFKTVTQLRTSVTNQAGGKADVVFDLDLTKTQLQSGSFQVGQNVQDGQATARLTNVTIDGQGRIVAVYGTGQQRYVGQVALVHFDNFDGMAPIGSNVFAATQQSGTEYSDEGVLVGRAGDGGFGDIKAQSIESSNVDMANELVRLMVLQRAYSANSQGMRAYDQTLRDTLQMMG